MSKLRVLQNFKMSKRYILTPRRQKPLNIDLEVLYEDLDETWHYKAQKLQARRWRKIKHQTA